MYRLATKAEPPGLLHISQCGIRLQESKTQRVKRHIAPPVAKCAIEKYFPCPETTQTNSKQYARPTWLQRGSCNY